jgi:hypothetical protein
VFNSGQPSGFPLAEDCLALETPPQENCNVELPAVPQQANSSLKTQRDHGTSNSGYDSHQAVSLRKMRLSIFPLVSLRKFQSGPARNRVVIQTRSSRVCTFRRTDADQARLLSRALGLWSLSHLAIPTCLF